MLALGIDPGTAICGYGFVEEKGSRLIAHEYGAITTSPKARPEDRLMTIYDSLDELIKKYHPDVMGVEQLFSTGMLLQQYLWDKLVAWCFWLLQRMEFSWWSVHRCR